MVEPFSRLRIRLIIAALLFFIGVGISVANWFDFSSGPPVNVPINLKNGYSTTVNFKVPKTRNYNVGIEMDEIEAAKLYPFEVDPLRFNIACKSALPIKANIRIHEDGKDISDRLEIMTNYCAGGSYYAGKFNREVGKIGLSHGKVYSLTFKSEREGSMLEPAKPKLNVSMDSGYLETDMILRLGRFVVGLIISIISIVSIIFLLRSKKLT